MSPSTPPPGTTVAELKVELEREQGKLRALQDIGKALGSTLDLDELLLLILDRRLTPSRTFPRTRPAVGCY